MNMLNSFRNPQRQTDILAAMKNVATSGHLLEGAYVFSLEKSLSMMMRGQAAIAFNSVGSAALAMFIQYAKRGLTRVAIQNNSSVPVAAMALQAGMQLYLVDSGRNDPAMSVETLTRVLNDNPKIEMVVLSHVGGWLLKEYQQLHGLCFDRGLTVVEDCSSVLGVKAAFAPGTLSECSLWNFHPDGAVPAGTGGVLCTADPEVRNGAKLFRSMGRTMHGDTYRYSGGMDLRMSEWDAAVCCVQLEHLPEIMAARARDAEKLQSIAPSLLSGPTNWERYPADPLLVPKKPTVPSMYALHEQIAHSLMTNRITLPNLPNSTRWAQNHRCLPVGEGLYDNMTTAEIVAYIAKL